MTPIRRRLVFAAMAWCAAAGAQSLDVSVLSGEGASNNTKASVSRELSVAVKDGQGKALGGAAVTFELPSAGASGTFLNGTRTATVTTDAEGKATTSFRPNSVAGSMAIRVTASSGGVAGNATINETNAAGASKGMSAGTKALIIIGVIGGAAAGGAIAIAGGKSSSSSSSPTPTPTPTPTPAISITPGTPTVGGPK